MKLSTPELEAEIHYLKESEGGRRTGVRSGYRGQFHYNGKDWDAFQQFLDREICQPGETVKVHLQTASADFHVGKMKIGQEFEIREGARIVGKGKITKILRVDFNYWDYSTFLEFLGKDAKPYSEAMTCGSSDKIWNPICAISDSLTKLNLKQVVIRHV